MRKTSGTLDKRDQEGKISDCNKFAKFVLLCVLLYALHMRFVFVTHYRMRRAQGAAPGRSFACHSTKGRKHVECILTIDNGELAILTYS
jgi:hypothetical protein